MRDRLAGGLAIVDTDVESGRGELIKESGANLGDELPELSLVGFRQIKDAGDVLAGDDEGVSVCNWKGIEEGDRCRVLGDD